MWLLIFLLLAPFTPKIDLYLSSIFYTPGLGFYNNALFSILFNYGELFGLATGALASLVLLLSFIGSRWKKWRSGALAILLTLVVGAGLITNVGFKGFWARPRPKQIYEFGGKHSYQPFWHPQLQSRQDPQKSFPSGHVAMGCYFFSLVYIGRRYRKRFFFFLGIFLTSFLGGGLMIARIAQGGHFFSDVFASAVLMWYMAKIIDRITWGEFAQRILHPKQPDIYLKPDGG